MAALVAIAGALGPVAVTASGAASEQGLVTEVEYSGSYSHTFTGYALAGIANVPLWGIESIDVSYDFVESTELFTPESALLASSGGLNNQDEPIALKLNGTETVNYSKKPAQSCTSTFVGISGLLPITWGTITSPIGISVNQATSKGKVEVYARAPGLFPIEPDLQPFVTGGDTSPQSPCRYPFGPMGPCNTPITDQTDPNWAYGTGWREPQVSMDPHTPTYSRRIHVHDAVDVARCGGTDTVIADSRLIVNNHAGTGANPYFYSNIDWAKMAAQDDIRWSLGFGQQVCGVLATGLAFTGVGLITGNAAIAGSGSILTALASPTQPICVQLGLRIHEDLGTIHDPPVSSYRDLARTGPAPRVDLPSCARVPAAGRSLCQQLRAAASALESASTALSSLDGAIATTVDRWSGAKRAHDASATASQYRQLLTLSERHGTELAAEQTAAAALAQVLGAAGVDAKVTPSQAAAAHARFAGELARAGAGASALAPYTRAWAPVRGSLVASLSLGTVAPVPASSSTTTTAPSGPGASITSVGFTGDPAYPTIVIHGVRLGPRPAPDPSEHPSGLNGCPVVAGDGGYDYGLSLYIAASGQGWSAGRYQPNLNETDCADLVIVSYSATSVTVRLGPFYARFLKKSWLAGGDAVTVAVNGATRSVHVKFGSTVTS